MIIRLFFCLALIANAGFGQITNMRLAGVTATQAVLEFTAPDTNDCTVAVSTSPSLTPLVHAVDPALFPAANIAGGGARTRTIVIGSRNVRSGSDGIRYSLALQTLTPYWYQITCGSFTASGRFVTTNIPLGNTYSDPPLVDPENPGYWLWPSRDWTTGQTDGLRKASWVDAQTGVLVTQATLPTDQTVSPALTNVTFTSQGPGTNWTGNAVNATATYNGASCAPSCDKLFVRYSYPDAGDAGKIQNRRINYINLLFTNSSGTSEIQADRDVNACITLDGVTCDSLGNTLVAHLPTSAGSVTLGTTTPIDTWRPASAPQNIIPEDLASTSNFGFLLWKANNTGSVTIHVQLTIARGGDHANPSGGNFDQCSQSTDSNGFYHCVSRTDAYDCGSSQLFAVNARTPEVRYLGSTGLCLDNATWDYNDPNVIWLWGGDGTNNKIIKWTYDGSDTPVASGTSTSAHVTQTTILTKAQTDTLLAAFDPSWDGTKFTCAKTLDTTPDYLMATCSRSIQNSIGWGVVWAIGDGRAYPECTGCGIAAAAPLYLRSYGRYSGPHSLEINHGNLFYITAYELPGNHSNGCAVGCGEYVTTLVNAASTGATQITMAGEPTSPNPDTSIYTAIPGDCFNLGATQDSGFSWVGGEGVCIVSRTAPGITPIVWTLQRGLTKNHAAGEIAYPHSESAYGMGSPPTGTWNASGSNVVWDPIGDPHATDNTGYPTRTDQAFVRMDYWRTNVHETLRKDYFVDEDYRYQNCGQANAVACTNIPITTAVTRAPTFAGFQAPNAGTGYQSHPTIHQVSAPPSEWPYFSDGLVYSGGTNSLSQVTTTGQAHLYLVTNRQYPYVPKILPLAGACGDHPLTDISSPGSILDDTKPYSMCQAQIAGECVTSSAPGDIYLDCPAISGAAPAGCPNTTGGVFSNYGCVWAWPTYAQAVTQIGVSPCKEGGFQILAGITYQGGGCDARVIQRDGAPWTINNKWAGRELPDGSGMWNASMVAERTEMTMLTLPPIPPKDTVNRSTWVPVPVSLRPPAGLNVSTAIVEFGYDPDLASCSPNRREVCVADASTISSNRPYKWASLGNAGDANNLVTGVPCANGCTIPIPGLSQKVLYYRWKYRDGSGNVLAASQIMTAAVP